MDSVRPCAKHLKAIHGFPTPRNITDVRAWFGIVNQVSYAFSMAERMRPFRDLLKPSTPFHWDNHLDALFRESKQVIIDEIQEGVKIFDTSRPTCLATDWSKTGIGFWLFQKHCECPGDLPFCCKGGWKITLMGSRFTSAAESRYKPIEGEALAVAEGLDKARFFVLGCDKLTVAVDHKPLLKILTDRSLEAIPNARLRNLKEKTLRYRFKVTYVPGTKNKAADAASRYPSGPRRQETLPLPDDSAVIQHAVHPLQSLQALITGACLDELTGGASHDIDLTLRETAADSLSCTSVTWDRVKAETASDGDMQRLVQLVEDDAMPERKEALPESLRPYHRFRGDLLALDGVVLYKERVVIPPKLRPAVLTALHAAHQGTQAMLSRAETAVFWPGITVAIQETRARCGACNRMAPSQPRAPPTPPVAPEYPFQCICADFFHYMGSNYLVIVDRYSNWPIVERSSDGSSGLMAGLRRVFITYGIPQELASDGGPEFTAASTKTFLRDWGVDHRMSSVAFPHSNCRAEVAVKTVKRLITGNTGPNGTIDTNEFAAAMLTYRNTPDPETRMSPASVIFGRPIRDLIPIMPGKYLPHATWQETLAAREEALKKRHVKAAERWSEHTRRLPPLAVGNHVRIQNQVGPNPRRWDKTGQVVEVRQHDQYVIKVDGSGRVTLRNRQFLRRFYPAVDERPAPRLLTDDLEFRPPPTPPRMLTHARRLSEPAVTEDSESGMLPAPPTPPIDDPSTTPAEPSEPDSTASRSPSPPTNLGGSDTPASPPPPSPPPRDPATPEVGPSSPRSPPAAGPQPQAPPSPPPRRLRLRGDPGGREAAPPGSPTMCAMRCTDAHSTCTSANRV